MSLKKLEKLINNNGYRVKIKLRKLSDDRYSLYLDYRQRINYKEIRERHNLKLYITGNPKQYGTEKELVKQALVIREHFEKIQQSRKNGIFGEADKGNIYLITWMERFRDAQIKYNSKKSWSSMILKLKSFRKKDILLKNVNREYCQDFAKYLLECKTINQNSAHTYFTRFKIGINKAYEEDIIPRNYTKNIVIRKKDAKREFLTINEVKTLYEMSYVNERVKRAFIFSCFTGLRLGDLYELKFSDIIQDGNQHYISFIDEKTQEFNKFNLHPTAIKIIEIEKKDHTTENVFVLPCKSTFGYHVEKMIKIAGIRKHITPHCGRHTFATLSINNGIDLYTLSKYMGHNDVKVTQLYAKLIDKTKDEAIYKIPEI